MDSHHVVAGINTGLILSYEAHSRYRNSDLWTTLKGLIEEAIRLGLSITWRWIPRSKNRCADEIANAVLDDRVVDTTVVNSSGLETVNITNLHKLLIRLTNRRVRFIKHLPPTLNLLLVAFMDSIMLRFDAQRSTLRLLFICVPAIISMYNQSGGFQVPPCAFAPSPRARIPCKLHTRPVQRHYNPRQSSQAS